MLQHGVLVLRIPRDLQLPSTSRLRRLVLGTAKMADDWVL